MSEFLILLHWSVFLSAWPIIHCFDYSCFVISSSASSVLNLCFFLFKSRQILANLSPLYGPLYFNADFLISLLFPQKNLLEF